MTAAKFLGLVFCCIALVLLLLAMNADDWYGTNDYHFGLWRLCWRENKTCHFFGLKAPGKHLQKLASYIGGMVVSCAVRIPSPPTKPPIILANPLPEATLSIDPMEGEPCRIRTLHMTCSVADLGSLEEKHL